MNQDIEKYLESGEQTTPSEKLKEIFPKTQIRHLEDIFPLLDFIHKKLKLDEDRKKELFRKRTAEEILESGFATGCTDYTLALLPLLRYNGIPARYVEAIRNRWLKQGTEEFLEGHVFVEAFLDNSWYIINPQESTISNHYTRHQVIAKGLDSWDIGIKDVESLKKRFLELRSKR